jgi:hypothetical protein
LGTRSREIRFSAMEQEGCDPVFIGRLTPGGEYELEASKAARRLRVEPDRIGRMAATVPAFERLAANMAHVVAIAYAQTGGPRPALEARWGIMTLDHPRRSDQLVWSELVLADADPDTRVYLRHLDGNTIFNPPCLRLGVIKPHARPSYLRLSQLEASAEPWASLRLSLPEQFGSREVDLLPAWVECRAKALVSKKP